MKLFTKILVLASCLLFVPVAPGWCVDVGQRLPDFSIRTLEGKSMSARSFKGEPLLLVFWNTWCPICVKELPKINRLAGQPGAENLTVLAVNTAINDSESKARAYWKKSGFRFPTAYDHDFEIGSAFGIIGVPTIFLVDSAGIVRFKQARLPADMNSYLKKLTGSSK